MAGEADRRARLREEARQRALEALRARPRSIDSPELEAWFAEDDRSDVETAEAFVRLAGAIGRVCRCAAEWRVVRTAADHRTQSGIDVLSDPQGFADWSIAASEGGPIHLSALGFSPQVPREDPRFYTASLTYDGATSTGPAHLFFAPKVYETDPVHPMPLDEWRAVVAAVVTWRRPLFLRVGTKNYPLRDAVFDHRMWGGWMGWIAGEVPEASLPDHARAERVGDGTLVRVQDENVDTGDPDQVARANAVEVALAELGVLPARVDILGR